ncbi:peroxisomal membrane protein 11C isoform X2 [Equus asinus]|uniref:peroxisomal membrane protein 11C isoform X2 n=1 Tax=Equus asinus TaxID=9793 RepID=UPI0038F6FB68
MAALSGLASALESYRARDRLIRTLGYCCQLVGGVLVQQCPARSEVGTRLLALSSQLSHCRTVLRLFDDAAMFVYTKQYGLGAEEEDIFVRCVSVLGNLADQLYYPCEHVAWAADAKILRVDSARWWTLSTAFWGLSLLLGIARSLWMVLKLRQRLRGPTVPCARRWEDRAQWAAAVPGASCAIRRVFFYKERLRPEAAGMEGCWGQCGMQRRPCVAPGRSALAGPSVGAPSARSSWVGPLG